MPPVLLGATLFAAFLIILILRKPLERLFVLSVVDTDQPKRQFFLDISICLVAVFCVVLYNNIFHNFPLIMSGGKLVLGCLVAGFFFSLDMALARERTVILDAVARDTSLPPPKRLYSMTRKFSLVAISATLFVSIIIVLVISKDIAWLSKIEQNAIALSQAQESVMYEIFFIMAVLLAMIVNLIFSYSRNLRLLFDNETGVLEQITRGDLTKIVPVATHDEFGVIAGHTNKMIQGLRHRMKLITALKLAEEVQQNLLPLTAPAYPDLDISGTSIYCDETGGDYYDYYKLPNGRLGVVVADASDHGVGAALHMTTARAFLIFGLQDFTGPARLFDEVNRFLTRDSSETGRFMSIFFLEIDSSAKTLRWVRAGHEPAILFDSSEKIFIKLTGKGVAMGIDEDFQFQEYEREGWTSGSIVIVGTDGIRETRNSEGDMFGLFRLQEVVRTHAAESAESIQNAVIEALNTFQGDAPQEDDITLVVIKLL
jgi:sigma-B regulation protein RsbU (phosphoserine phosphatase)